MPEILKDNVLKEILNVDEIGLFWYVLPDKLLSVPEGGCNFGKYVKQQIMISLILNALGEKEPSVIVGSSVKPRRFKNMQDKSHPCSSYYYVDKNLGWIHSLWKKFSELQTENAQQKTGKNCFSQIMIQVIQNRLLVVFPMSKFFSCQVIQHPHCSHLILDYTLFYKKTLFLPDPEFS